MIQKISVQELAQFLIALGFTKLASKYNGEIVVEYMGAKYIFNKIQGEPGYIFTEEEVYA